MHIICCNSAVAARSSRGEELHGGEGMLNLINQNASAQTTARYMLHHIQKSNKPGRACACDTPGVQQIGCYSGVDFVFYAHHIEVSGALNPTPPPRPHTSGPRRSCTCDSIVQVLAFSELAFTGEWAGEEEAAYAGGWAPAEYDYSHEGHDHGGHEGHDHGADHEPLEEELAEEEVLRQGGKVLLKHRALDYHAIADRQGLTQRDVGMIDVPAQCHFRTCRVVIALEAMV